MNETSKSVENSDAMDPKRRQMLEQVEKDGPSCLGLFRRASLEYTRLEKKRAARLSFFFVRLSVGTTSSG